MEKENKRSENKSEVDSKKKRVFNFNHIDQRNKERKEELEKLFKFYHKLWYCYKKVHLRTKKINFYFNMFSATLVTTGTVVGGVTMNPILLGILSGLGVLIKTAMEWKNLQKKIQNANVAFTAYAKVLSDLRNVLCGEEFHKEEYLQKLKTLDEMVIDMSLKWEKFIGKYKEEFET